MSRVIYINKRPIVLEIKVLDTNVNEIYYQKMLEAWCERNCEGAWVVNISNLCQGQYRKGKVLFSEENDAALFKLTWSEEEIK